MPITEIHDHQLLICLAEGMIRMLNHNISQRRSHVVAITADVAKLEQEKLLALGVANIDAFIKEKLSEREEENKEIFRLEQRREKLFFWIRYMKTLDREATRIQENQENYSKMQQEAIKQSMAILFNEENIPTIYAAREAIIVVLKKESEEYKGLITTIDSFSQSVTNLQKEATKAVKEIAEFEREADRNIQELETLKSKHPEYKAAIEEMIKDIQAGKDEFIKTKESIQEIASDAADDSEMMQDLRSRNELLKKELAATEELSERLQKLPIDPIRQHDREESEGLGAAFAQPTVPAAELDPHAFLRELKATQKSVTGLAVADSQEGALHARGPAGVMQEGAPQARGPAGMPQEGTPQARWPAGMPQEGDMQNGGEEDIREQIRDVESQHIARADQLRAEQRSILDMRKAIDGVSEKIRDIMQEIAFVSSEISRLKTAFSTAMEEHNVTEFERIKKKLKMKLEEVDSLRSAHIQYQRYREIINKVRACTKKTPTESEIDLSIQPRRSQTGASTTFSPLYQHHTSSSLPLHIVAETQNPTVATTLIPGEEPDKRIANERDSRSEHDSTRPKS